MNITEDTEGKPLHEWMRLTWRINADDKKWAPHQKRAKA